ncbi:MAG: FHIPEP family type III secretion protein, partial [Armatimonadetes bacterium]|nr:FHIPEP family type III secretion protein [Armatimonadota bacterium]
MTTGRAIAVSLVGLGAVAVVVPGAAQPVVVVALLHLAIGMALPTLVGTHTPHSNELPATLVLLSVGRAVAALAAIRVVVSPGPGTDLVPWVADILGPAGALALFAALAVVAGIMVSSGAVRVAEVAARFALDAMPGKQLGLDTVLQRSSLDATAAAERLQALEREAGFFGAMDGATRFLRAESVALTGVGVFGIAFAGGVHAASWAQPVAFTAAVFGLLLAAAAATGTQAALAVTQAAGGGDARPIPIVAIPRLWAALAGAVGALFVVIGVSSRPAAGLSVAVGVALLVGGVIIAVRPRVHLRMSSRAGLWTIYLPSSLRAVAGEEIASALSAAREDFKLRLGFDPGEASVIFTEQGDDLQAEV